MRLFVGSDHAGIELRRTLVAHAERSGHTVAGEFGPSDANESVDYPAFAKQVGRAVLSSPGSYGLLVCGTGQGMAMTANRLHGIRAAVCTDAYSAKMARLHNDANVLCLGARVVGSGLAVDIFDAFSLGVFEGGRHQRRVDAIESVGAAAYPAPKRP